PLVRAEPAAASSDAALAALPPPPIVQPTENKPDLGPGNLPLVPLRVPAELASRSVKAVPREFAQRDPQQHAAALAARGGSERTEQAVTAALAWLANQQRPDGRWDPRMTGGGIERSELGQERRGAGLRSDNGITGLALLAFLGAGHTTEKGEYREVVARGVEYLVRTQSSDGFLGGAALNFERTYCHGMATLALAEALALSSDERLKPAVQRAVSYTVNAQSRQDGGWRYQPGESGDMSQFGWQVLALHSAELGGVFTPEQTREGMRRFLGASTRGGARGLGCYRPGEGVSPTMTAEALLCRHLIEREIDPRTVDEATNYLLQSLPSERAVNEYYWYYGTLAMYHVGGRPWQRWNERLTEVLISRQIVAGADAGAWPADGMWAGYGGRVFSTALSTLCLEVYYRYQPSHEKN
ncbi:MAG: prenyltransferase/squalene oxidase repeat-containing protein, partial [Planctomycetota bacterium]